MGMKMTWNQWALLVIGVWLLISPWFLGFSELDLVTWNAVVAGALVILFAFWDHVSQ